MKTGIHPNYMDTTVNCACGNTFQTRSTKPEIRVEICANCHPFYTGTQKIIDSEGRVDRFIRRYGLQDRYTRGEAKKKEQ
jgi:large subunit ribosomal protein L31